MPPNLLAADIQTNGVRVDTRVCPVGGGLDTRIRIGEPPLAGGRRAARPSQDHAKPCLAIVCSSRARHGQQPRFLAAASLGLHGCTVMKSELSTSTLPVAVVVFPTRNTFVSLR